MRSDVEVCFATTEQQIVLAVELTSPATIRQTIERSGILDWGLGIDLHNNPVGIFGIRRPLDWLVQQHDRIEIYRPLRVHPTVARRLRAANKAAKQ